VNITVVSISKSSFHFLLFHFVLNEFFPKSSRDLLVEKQTKAIVTIRNISGLGCTTAATHITRITALMV